MSTKKSLLIVCNTPSANTQTLADATVLGASHLDIENFDVVFRSALNATSEDVLNCQGIIIGTTENFGYMSGLIKDFFERIYYPCLEHTEGLPYALYIRAGIDGQGTLTGVEKIITGLRWRRVQEPIVLQGDYQEGFTEQCKELGMSIAAGLDANIY
ncbi:MAG: flavodoxin family protein [Granulosicoccaceae bacterium]